METKIETLKKKITNTKDSKLKDALTKRLVVLKSDKIVQK